jgi:uncharacterized protein (TIGR03086 family)
MTDTGPTPLPAGAFGLLDEAIAYASGAVRVVTPQSLTGPTPCSGWDMRTLLHHLTDALDVLAEGIDTGCVTLRPVVVSDVDGESDPAVTFLARAGRIRARCRDGGRHQTISISGHPVTTSMIAAVVAVEIAVHGWDVSQASGQAQPIPDALAIGLLAIVALVVADTTRHRLFAAAVAVSSQASPGDRLVAFLGRSPR